MQGAMSPMLFSYYVHSTTYLLVLLDKPSDDPMILTARAVQAVVQRHTIQSTCSNTMAIARLTL